MGRYILNCMDSASDVLPLPADNFSGCESHRLMLNLLLRIFFTHPQKTADMFKTPTRKGMNWLLECKGDIDRSIRLTLIISSANAIDEPPIRPRKTNLTVRRTTMRPLDSLALCWNATPFHPIDRPNRTACREKKSVLSAPRHPNTDIALLNLIQLGL